MNRRAFILAAAAVPAALGGCVHSPHMSPRWQTLPALPDALGVAGAFAGVSGGQLLVAGGANFPRGLPWEGGTKIWHDTVYQLDLPQGRWRAAGRLPRPLGYGVSITTPQGLICIGGSDATRHFPGVFRLFTDTTGVRVEPLPSLPTPLANAAGVLVRETILVSGGSAEPGERTASNHLIALDLKRPAAGWQTLAPLPAAPRFLAVAAADGGDFFLFGGVALVQRDGKTVRDYLHDAWCYRTGSGWERLPNLPRPLAAAASPAPTMGDEFLLLPGDDGSLAGFQPPARHPGFHRRMLAYNRRTQTWRDAGKAPFAHVTTPCVPWRGRHIIPSGEVRPGVRSPAVWALTFS